MAMTAPEGTEERGPRPPRGRGYLRTAEVAELLHVSPKTISRWAKEGKLPFVTTLGGHRRYPEQPIQDIVDRLASNAIEFVDD